MKPLARHDKIAERIIKVEGLAFALAASVGKELDTARAFLKEAICRELESEFNRGAELQRRSMEGNALMDDLEKMINR